MKIEPITTDDGLRDWRICDELERVSPRQLAGALLIIVVGIAILGVVMALRRWSPCA